MKKLLALLALFSFAPLGVAQPPQAPCPPQAPALAVAATTTTYADAYRDAQRRSLPLVAFVGCELREVAGAVSVRVDALPGWDDAPCVVVGRPGGNCRTLPADTPAGRILSGCGCTNCPGGGCQYPGQCGSPECGLLRSVQSPSSSPGVPLGSYFVPSPPAFTFASPPMRFGGGPISFGGGRGGSC